MATGEPGAPHVDAPLVSVIIPAYNHERYIQQTLQSIEDQTYLNVEAVVIDDGSRDGTLRVARDFAARSRRPIRVFTQENRGVTKTLARGLAESRGEYVSFLASDDWIFPDKLAFQVDDLHRHAADAIFGNVVKVTGDIVRDPYVGPMPFLDHWDAERFIERLVTAHGPFIQSGLFRRSLIDAIGGVDHGFPQEDWPILILAARAARRVRVHPRPFTYYRLHDTNTVRVEKQALRGWKIDIINRYLAGRTRRHAIAAAHLHLGLAQIRVEPWSSLANYGRSLSYLESWKWMPRYTRRWIMDNPVAFGVRILRRLHLWPR